MRHQTRYHAIMITVVGLTLLGISRATAAARMVPVTGMISAIEPAAQTVVIEFPQGQQTFTVRGPLSPKTVVKKGGKAAHVEDCHVGNQVRVAWLHTANGHEITRLEAR
jgi:hypothetical protein